MMNSFRSVSPLLLLFPLTLHAAPADVELALQARGVLERHCYACHGQEGTNKGGFAHILDHARLLRSAKVIPGDPARSELLQRIVKNEMPPAKKPRLSATEITLLRRWIANGAAGWSEPTRPRLFVSETEVQRLIAQDRAALSVRQRSHMRYVSLVALGNAGVPRADLERTRQALAKVLNSLSWHPRLASLHPINPEQTILRLDLRDYQWTARHWERLVTLYPYRRGETRAEELVLRGDWVVATASRAPLYYDLLDLPVTDRALERLLRVDAAQNIQDDNVLRAGFNNSGVSRNNRVLERHHASHGAYWRSYDFSENTGRQNLFEYPLGPSAGATSFKQAGGEIIFTLPNGLHGYMLVDGNGRRVNKAPVEIVSDPKRPDRQVEAGLSCMTCHERGILPKEDQIRAHVEKNAAVFRSEDRAAIRAIYPPVAIMRRWMEEDANRYQKALKEIGISVGESEPVSAVTLRYEAVLDLAEAAAELGVTSDELLSRLKAAPGVQRLLGALQSPRGNVQRQVFEESYPRLVRELKLGDVSALPVTPTTTPGLRFAGHEGGVRSLSISPDGKHILSGGEDRTVRLWEPEHGKEVRMMQGHRGAVLAVAWAPDGKTFASAGEDRVVRWWDTATGRERAQLVGHTDRVRTLAFSPDGRHLVSGGDDRVLRLWDLERAREIRTFNGHSGAVHAVVFARDGKRLLSGGGEGSVRLWNVRTGKEMAVWQGHTRAVLCVAFAPSGDQAVSGDAAGEVRLWAVASGKPLHLLSSRGNAVVCVEFRKEGQEILAGCSQYENPEALIRVWNSREGKELRRVTSPGRFWCVAFAPTGAWALAAGPEAGMWQWREK